MSKDLADIAGSPTIHRARPEQAPAIYDLLVKGFGGNYLPYTIYQTPRSVGYLAQLIAEAHRQSEQQLFVLKWDGRICGYYHAVLRERQLLLNYIAIASDVKGRGLGGALLRHFEEIGTDTRCHSLTLDVFGTNPFAREWYFRHGYHLAAESYHVRLTVDSLMNSGDGAFPLSLDSTAWTRAREAEDRYGFSKVECECGPGHLTLGLIAGTAWKLLNFDGVTLEAAALAIAKHWRDERPILIVSGVRALPRIGTVLSADKTARLVKQMGSS